MDTLALKIWRQDVLHSLVFQWSLLLVIAVCLLVVNTVTAVNALIGGAAIAIPSTVLGAWMGVKVLLGGVNPLSVLFASLLKTVLSVVFMIAALYVLQDNPEIEVSWLGFLVGLVVTALAPAVYGVAWGFYTKIMLNS